MLAGIDINQLRHIIVRPTLQHLDLWSQAAENLLLGTICQESHAGKYVKQLGTGPAMGMCQMEPATHDDIWNNYLRYHDDLAAKVRVLELDGWYDDDNANEMAGNAYYAVAMCRIHYRRVPQSLPNASDTVGLAKYWKQFYNSALGAGTVEEFMNNYARFGVGD